MKILLTNPKVIYENRIVPADFWRCFARLLSVTFPQLAASIYPVYQYDIFDGIAEGVHIKKYINLLTKYDVICMSVCAPNVALNAEISIKLIKKISNTILKHSDFVVTAAKAGLKEVIIGYEATDDNILKAYRKAMSNYRAKDFTNR